MNIDYLSLLKKAIRISSIAHAGQVDIGGVIYIFHPLAVMKNVNSYVKKIVAVLHDVVEDTDITFEYLKSEGFTDEIVDAIDALTKRENEVYVDFIKRIKLNKIARIVKIADLNDNLHEGRIFYIKNTSLVKRYKLALEELSFNRSKKNKKKKEIKRMEKEIRYIYFGKNSGLATHDGIVAVGYTYNNDLKKMMYSVAFCSPNDRFMKNKSHRIIAARFNNNMVETSSDVYDKPPKFGDTIADVIKMFSNVYDNHTEGDKVDNSSLKFGGIKIPRWCGREIFAPRV